MNSIRGGYFKFLQELQICNLQGAISKTIIKMRNLGGSIIFLVIILLIDFYVFQGLRAVGAHWGNRTRILVFGGYWVACALCIALFATLPYFQYEQWPKFVRSYLFAICVGFVMAQILVLPFLLIDDLRRLLQWIIAHFISRNTDAAPGNEAAEGISRSVFLSWLGLGVGGTLFSSLLYGFRNKYNYQVKKIKLRYDNLPAAFHGFRMVHISDIHSGSFNDSEAVLRGVELINNQHADVIFFTGDLVNDKAVEMLPYVDVFKRLTAPLGVFSTFGNHDYGDYTRWKDEEAKLANQHRLRKIHHEMGWRLLWDENILLEKDGQKIGVAGVQNISGRQNFHSYGNLAKAAKFGDEVPFKILLSHDPSHWDAEVVPKFPEFDLMLSGHTHGMQFGVELPGFRWSPVQWVYKQWAGLYEQGRQRLYVNRGFGFIGYPGRVGILPEITVIELAST